MKFARVDGIKNQKDYVILYAGKNIDYIKRDLRQFSDDYDLDSFEEVPFSYMMELCESGWGQYRDKTRGHGKIFSAINAIAKGSTAYCIDHINKEIANSLDLEVVDIQENEELDSKKDTLRFNMIIL